MPTPGEEVDDNIRRQNADDRAAMDAGQRRREIADANYHTDEAAELQAEEDRRNGRFDLDAAVKRIEAKEGPENPLAAEPELSSISEEELQERLAEMSATCPTGGCSGPQCASSVLATRYAKILRQERLLAMAASAMETMEKEILQWKLPSAGSSVERSAAIRREIDKERKEEA